MYIGSIYIIPPEDEYWSQVTNMKPSDAYFTEVGKVLQ